MAKLANKRPHKVLIRRFTVIPPEMSGNINEYTFSKSVTNFSTEPSADIVTVLNAAMGCESSDLRDRVYALLDMTAVDLNRVGDSVTSSNAITIDYSKSTRVVFADVARYVLQRDRVVDLLYIKAMFGTESDLDLPSWVPDWRHATTRTYCIQIQEVKRIAYYAKDIASAPSRRPRLWTHLSRKLFPSKVKEKRWTYSLRGEQSTVTHK